MAADDDLDRRIAEASAAVDALRLQSSKLDRELELRGARTPCAGAEPTGAPGPSAAAPASEAPRAAVREDVAAPLPEQASQQPLDATQPSPAWAARAAFVGDEWRPEAAPGTAASLADRGSPPAAELATEDEWRPEAAPGTAAPPASPPAASAPAPLAPAPEAASPAARSPSPAEEAAAADWPGRPPSRGEGPPPRESPGPPRRHFSRPSAGSPDAAEDGVAGRVPVPPPGPPPAHAQARAGGGARPLRGAARSQPRPDYPSDADVASMSRRERIALLEEGPDAAGRPAGRPAARPAAPPRGGAAQGGAAPEGGEEPAEDDDWERRRQKRKARLQQHTGPRAARGDGRGDDHPAPDSTTQVPRAALRSTAGADEEPAAAEAPAPGGRAVAAVAPAAGQALLQELDGAARLGFEDPRWLSTCAALKAGVHRLTVGQLVRAVECLAGAPRGLDACADEAASAACREAADALLACLAPQLGNLGVAAVVDALRLMALSRVSEQTYLDMLLSQLAVLMRRDKAVVAVSMVVVANAIGSLHADGVSAKKATSAAGSAANKRCVESVAEEVVARLDELREEQLARVGAPFVVTFLDDTQRRAFLRRSAELEVGLRVTSSEWLGAMKEIERAVRSHSFAFVASLPDHAKDYLMRLKAAE